MKEYKITIRETLEMEVTVSAKDRASAEQIVRSRWNNGDYILDADHFTGVEFATEEVSPNKESFRNSSDRFMDDAR